MRELRARAVPGGAGWSGSATGARDSRACRAATAACFWTLRECIAQLPFRVDAISRGGAFKPSSVSGNAHADIRQSNSKCRLLGGTLGSCGSCETCLDFAFTLFSLYGARLFGDRGSAGGARRRCALCGVWKLANRCACVARGQSPRLGRNLSGLTSPRRGRGRLAVALNQADRKSHRHSRRTRAKHRLARLPAWT